MNADLKIDHKSTIERKSDDFALGVVFLDQILSENKEFILSKQFMRSGTSIGANVKESQSAESKKDFIHKLNISLKEARETSYWLNLLYDANYITKNEHDELDNRCNELTKILSSIIITTRKKHLNN